MSSFVESVCVGVFKGFPQGVGLGVCVVGRTDENINVLRCLVAHGVCIGLLFVTFLYVAALAHHIPRTLPCSPSTLACSLVVFLNGSDVRGGGNSRIGPESATG